MAVLYQNKLRLRFFSFDVWIWHISSSGIPEESPQSSPHILKWLVQVALSPFWSFKCECEFQFCFAGRSQVRSRWRQCGLLTRVHLCWLPGLEQFFQKIVRIVGRQEASNRYSYHVLSGLLYKTQHSPERTFTSKITNRTWRKLQAPVLWPQRYVSFFLRCTCPYWDDVVSSISDASVTSINLCSTCTGENSFLPPVFSYYTRNIWISVGNFSIWH